MNTMKDYPLVSIIINNYNYEHFLSDAIDSAINQTYKNLEIIVVDDGSTDNSRDVIESYGQKITPLFKENGGQPSAFNTGLQVSHGVVICFLDSDDILFPTALEEAVPFFKDPDVVKLHWPLWEVDESGNKTGGIIPDSDLDEGNLLEKTIDDGPYRYTTSPTSGNAWARSYIEKVFPIRDLMENKHEADAYLSILAPLFGQIKKVPKPQSFYRIHSDNFSGIKKKRKRKVKVFVKYCYLLKEYLTKIGFLVDINRWIKKYYSFEYEVIKSARELRSFIPQGTKFILVEDGSFQCEFSANKNAIPFIERDGKFWGPPADDNTAICELERLRQSGACFIAFLTSGFWWLDYYSGLRQYLQTKYRCVMENKYLIVFDLGR